MSPFEIQGDQFLLDGKPFRILSGAMHYFRVHPDYWEDRMLKMRLMGLNTLETYVAWNLHEPSPGQFNFSGWLDIASYIKLADQVGLQVLFRPGPYICSEWDMGGLPPWLLKDPAMKIRCCYQPYLNAVQGFFEKLIPLAVPLQTNRGGPIIAVQVENEYGSYGSDKVYLEWIANLLTQLGIEVPLFTSDNASPGAQSNGSLPGILATANFGSNAKSRFADLRRLQPGKPLVCMEFWNGWFDHWGEEHHTRDAEDTAQALDEILAEGGSVNLYMVHGGTNFGFMNGANYDGFYAPTITSYDSDAPIAEDGRLTEKYHALRGVLQQYAEVPNEPLPKKPRTQAVARFNLEPCGSLLALAGKLSTHVESPEPVPMEHLDQGYGFILYETTIRGPLESAELFVSELHDRAHVFQDGQLMGILERGTPHKVLRLDVPRSGAFLQILVENMGRINYGAQILDRKGITERVTLGSQVLHNWTIYPLSFDNIEGLSTSGKASTTTQLPAFYHGVFKAHPEHGDTFLFTRNWAKGCCWINGFNLGRYWKRGPQETLYIPAPLLSRQGNEIVLLELDEVTEASVEMLDHPILSSK